MAQYEFRFTEQHLVQSASRYRQQVLISVWLSPFKLLGFVGIAALLGVFVYNFLLLPSAIFAILLILLALGPRLDYWVMKRRFRRSPFYNGDVLVSISQAGVTCLDDKSKVELAWSAFTKARRFSDGFLVLLGPRQFYWWPHAALTSGTVPDVEALLRHHVPIYVSS